MRPADPPPITDLIWRPLEATDAPDILAMTRAVEVHDGLPFVSTLGDIEQSMSDPDLDLASDSLGGWLAGSLVCYGVARHRRQVTRRRAVQQDGHVHPDWRRRGLGNAVLAWTEERGRQQMATLDDDLPRFMEVWCNARAADRAALFGLRGYSPVRYYDEMRRSLSVPLPAAQLPDGLRLSDWSAELDDAFRVAHNSAFVDHWGSEPWAADQWRHHYTGSPHFRRDFTVAAVDDSGRVVAYVIGYHAPEDAATTGRIEGWLGQVGTVRDWRGRGVATALMVESMRRMLNAGMGHAVLDVDSENPSGAVGIYARLGFEGVERWIRWAKEATPAGQATPAR